MASLFTAPQFDGGSGIAPEDGLQLFFFAEGTNDNKDTFTTEALNIANSNPVISLSNGVFPEIWMAEGARYKVELKDKADNLAGFGTVETYISGSTAAFTAFGTALVGAADADAGRVVMNSMEKVAAAVTGNIMTFDADDEAQDSGSSVAETRAGRKNLVINPIFQINQDVISGSIVLASGVYGHDQWRAGTGGCTYTFSTSGRVTTVDISVGTLVQPINGEDVDGGAHVLSWTGTAQGQIDGGGFGDSGEVTVTLSSGAQALIEFGTGTLTEVQLEKGTASTRLEHTRRLAELKECQHFYFVETLAGQSAFSIADSSSIRNLTNDMPEVMRITPAVVANTLTTTAGVIGTVAAQSTRRYGIEVTTIAPTTNISAISGTIALSARLT